METQNRLRFDFDEMAQLASSDPVEFARRRQVLILQLIETSGQSEDMGRLQMALDVERYRSTPGVQSMERMHDLMLCKVECMDVYWRIYSGLAETKSE